MNFRVFSSATEMREALRELLLRVISGSLTPSIFLGSAWMRELLAELPEPQGRLHVACPGDVPAPPYDLAIVEKGSMDPESMKRLARESRRLVFACESPGAVEPFPARSDLDVLDPTDGEPWVFALREDYEKAKEVAGSESST